MAEKEVSAWGIIKLVEMLIDRKQVEIDKLKQTRKSLAALAPNHPYGRPKKTMAKWSVKDEAVRLGVGKGKGRKKPHWTQTPAGRRKMRELNKARWAGRRKKDAQ